MTRDRGSGRLFTRASPGRREFSRFPKTGLLGVVELVGVIIGLILIIVKQVVKKKGWIKFCYFLWFLEFSHFLEILDQVMVFQTHHFRSRNSKQIITFGNLKRTLQK